MRVLITGGTGFIGRHVVPALRAAGHTVVCASRHRPDTSDDWIPADFSRDVDPAVWRPRLQGIDVVINAVGIIQERGSQTFQSLHVDAPVALFTACADAGVSRVIQISALGADAQATSRYHLSKHRADQHLATLPLEWTIVQPSLVYGDDGSSTQLFGTLASLPWIPVPGRGDQRVQPVHVDDVVAGVVTALDNPATFRRVVPFVGPRALLLREYLAELREAMAVGRARFLFVPMPLMSAGARLAPLIPGSLLDEEALGMLVRGNTGDPQPLRQLLGRALRDPARFTTAASAEHLRVKSQLAWLLPMLRLSIAAVWIFTGIVSLGLYPPESSYQLLERTGVPRSLAPLFLYSAAALDLVFGVLTLMLRNRRWLWLAQIGLILGYTLIITVRLPEFWLHPYGPVLKNLPMLAAIYLLYSLEKR